MNLVASKLVERGGNQFYWQIRDDGQHRLTIDNVGSDEGKWVKYDETAKLSIGDKTYCADTWDITEDHQFTSQDLMRVYIGLKDSAPDSTFAKITVGAYTPNGKPIKGMDGKHIIETLEASTDIPADALGEVTAKCMQRAWRTGLDGTAIELRVTFA